MDAIVFLVESISPASLTAASWGFNFVVAAIGTAAFMAARKKPEIDMVLVFGIGCFGGFLFLWDRIIPFEGSTLPSSIALFAAGFGLNLIQLSIVISVVRTGGGFEVFLYGMDNVTGISVFGLRLASEVAMVATVLALSGFEFIGCLLYTSPSPRDQRGSRMPSSA